MQHFDGHDYHHARDGARLETQLEVIERLMSDHEWRTLDEISSATGYAGASVSAQLRNLRKERFGSRTVDRQHVGNGLYQYRLAA